MIWNKPKTLWQWLALVGPGAVSVAMTASGKLLSGNDQATPGILGFPLAFILCLALAFRLARGTGTAGKVLGLMLLWTFILVIVNFSIGLAGCAVVQPHIDFR